MSPTTTSAALPGRIQVCQNCWTSCWVMACSEASVPMPGKGARCPGHTPEAACQHARLHHGVLALLHRRFRGLDTPLDVGLPEARRGTASANRPSEASKRRLRLLSDGRAGRAGWGDKSAPRSSGLRRRPCCPGGPVPSGQQPAGQQGQAGLAWDPPRCRAGRPAGPPPRHARLVDMDHHHAVGQREGGRPWGSWMSSWPLALAGPGATAPRRSGCSRSAGLALAPAASRPQAPGLWPAAHGSPRAAEPEKRCAADWTEAGVTWR